MNHFPSWLRFARVKALKNHKLNFVLGLMNFLSVKVTGLHLRSSLCKWPRQKWYLTMCDLNTHFSIPTKRWPHDVEGQEYELGRRKEQLAFTFQALAHQPRATLSAVHSTAQRGLPCARQIKLSGNLIWYSWEGIFPLLSNPMKPGLAKAAELREWLNVQSPWRLKYSLSMRGRHFAFSLSGFLISIADY